MQTSQEYFTIIVYAKFGGQTECIMDNWKIVNETDTTENNAGVRNEEYISTPVSMSVTEAQPLHSSTEWAVKIDSTLNSYSNRYAPIPLPSQPKHSTPNHSSVPTTLDVPGSNSSPCVLTPIIIPTRSQC